MTDILVMVFFWAILFTTCTFCSNSNKLYCLGSISNLLWLFLIAISPTDNLRDVSIFFCACLTIYIGIKEYFLYKQLKNLYFYDKINGSNSGDFYYWSSDKKLLQRSDAIVNGKHTDINYK